MDPVILDTDVASRMLRGDLPEEARPKLSGRQGLLTFVTVGELLRGAYRARWGERRMKDVEGWIARFRQVDSSPDVSRARATLVAARENAGRPINPNDASIAACCIASGVPLATFNRKDFLGIEGLDLYLG